MSAEITGLTQLVENPAAVFLSVIKYLIGNSLPDDLPLGELAEWLENHPMPADSDPEITLHIEVDDAERAAYTLEVFVNYGKQLDVVLSLSTGGGKLWECWLQAIADPSKEEDSCQGSPEQDDHCEQYDLHGKLIIEEWESDDRTCDWQEKIYRDQHVKHISKYADHLRGLSQAMGGLLNHWLEVVL